MAQEEIQLRPVVKTFAERMELKLREKDEIREKRGWINNYKESLFFRLVEEVGELSKCILNHRDTESIVDEAVDVANFCMMICDNIYDLSDEE